MEIGKRVQVTLHIPLYPDIEVTARIRRHGRSDDGRPILGLEFTHTSDVTEDHIQSLMLVGHEPTWSSLASVLTGGSQVRVVTATAVGIDLAVARWDQVEPGSGELAWLLPPRLFEFMPPHEG